MAEYRLDGISGNAYKAAPMLAVSGSDWIPIAFDYLAGEMRTPAYHVAAMLYGLDARLVRYDNELPHLVCRDQGCRPADHDDQLVRDARN